MHVCILSASQLTGLCHNTMTVHFPCLLWCTLFVYSYYEFVTTLALMKPTLPPNYIHVVLQGYELSFCPEIGDATVGSLVTSTGKDSSVHAAGYFSALLYDVTCVDHTGTLVTLTDKEHRQQLMDYISCYGVMGICVEATLVCRKAAQIKTMFKTLPCNDYYALAKKLLQQRATGDNMFAMIAPDRFAYVELRHKVSCTDSAKLVCNWYFCRHIER